MSAPEHFSAWRVGVSGSSNALKPDAIEFCLAFGESLGSRPNVKIVHHGLKNRHRHSPDDLAADWHFIAGAKRSLIGDLNARIETLFTDESLNTAAAKHKDDASDNPVMFVEGDIRRVKSRTFQAKRFSFVSSLDALVAIAGGYGTQQQLVLASAVEIPLLPIPCCGGRSRAFWDENRDEIIDRLGITPEVATRWETLPETSAGIAELAREMAAQLVDGLPKRAFVIMPYAAEFDTLFDLVIRPAADSVGDELRRLDRLSVPGSVTAQIEEGIRTADYCVVVLDGFRSNVLYEMGFAQALRKPVVLILRVGELEQQADIPFDISTLQRIEYLRPDGKTLEGLRSAMENVVPRRFINRRR